MKNELFKKRKSLKIGVLKSKKGESYIDVSVMILLGMLMIALGVKLYPMYVAKTQLDTFATELIREAEISGQVGIETNQRAIVLRQQTGLDPQIIWSRSGRIQLNDEVTVTLKVNKNLGLFGGFGSFPITLTSKATGKSEIYHK